MNNKLARELSDNPPLPKGNEVVLIKRGAAGIDYFRSRQRGNVERVRQIAGLVTA